MTTIRAHFDGHVFVPETPVDLPVGKLVNVQLPDAPAVKDASSPPLLPLAELLGQFPPATDWPVDGAAQHEHYLYGLAKQTENNPPQ
jgi:hypothetical protein